MLIQALTPGTAWTAAGIGRFQAPTNALAIATGGQVRVGLEVNLHMDAGKTRMAGNPALVERLVALARANERDIASPTKRALIGLRPASTAAHGQTLVDG